MKEGTYSFCYCFYHDEGCLENLENFCCSNCKIGSIYYDGIDFCEIQNVSTYNEFSIDFYNSFYLQEFEIEENTAMISWLKYKLDSNLQIEDIESFKTRK